MKRKEAKKRLKLKVWKIWRKIIWNEFALLNNIQLFLMENYFIYGVQPNKPTKQCNLSFSYFALTDPLLLGFLKQVELSSLNCILFWKIVQVQKNLNPLCCWYRDRWINSSWWQCELMCLVKWIRRFINNFIWNTIAPWLRLIFVI